MSDSESISHGGKVVHGKLDSLSLEQVGNIVRNESSSDGSDALGTSFCKGGTARRSHCIATVAFSGGFLVFVAVSKKYNNYRHFVYKLPLSLPFTCTVTETNFILGVLACVDASQNSGKLDGVLSSSTVMISLQAQCLH